MSLEEILAHDPVISRRLLELLEQRRERAPTGASIAQSFLCALGGLVVVVGLIMAAEMVLNCVYDWFIR